jgi:hypothetical protein
MALRPRLSAGLPVSDDQVRSVHQLNVVHVTIATKTHVKGLRVDRFVSFDALQDLTGFHEVPRNGVEGETCQVSL